MEDLPAHRTKVKDRMQGIRESGIGESGDGAQAARAWQQTAVELVREELAQGSLIRLRVSGHSMAPLVTLGDVVLIQRANWEDLHRGDLLLVEQRGDFLVHRLVAANAHRLQTKGDNASHADLPLTPQAVLGRVVAVEKAGRRIELDRGCWPMVNRLLGLLGWGEVQLFTAGRMIKRRLGCTQSGRWMGLASLVATPFRWLTRLLVR
jgi:hypothetical protein